MLDTTTRTHEPLCGCLLYYIEFNKEKLMPNDSIQDSSTCSEAEQEFDRIVESYQNSYENVVNLINLYATGYKEIPCDIHITPFNTNQHVRSLINGFNRFTLHTAIAIASLCSVRKDEVAGLWSSMFSLFTEYAAYPSDDCLIVLSHHEVQQVHPKYSHCTQHIQYCSNMVFPTDCAFKTKDTLEDRYGLINMRPWVDSEQEYAWCVVDSGLTHSTVAGVYRADVCPVFCNNNPGVSKAPMYTLVYMYEQYLSNTKQTVVQCENLTPLVDYTIKELQNNSGVIPTNTKCTLTLCPQVGYGLLTLSVTEVIDRFGAVQSVPYELIVQPNNPSQIIMQFTPTTSKVTLKFEFMQMIAPEQFIDFNSPIYFGKTERHYVFMIESALPVTVLDEKDHLVCNKSELQFSVTPEFMGDCCGDPQTTITWYRMAVDYFGLIRKHASGGGTDKVLIKIYVQRTLLDSFLLPYNGVSSAILARFDMYQNFIQIPASILPLNCECCNKKCSGKDVSACMSRQIINRKDVLIGTPTVRVNAVIPVDMNTENNGSINIGESIMTDDSYLKHFCDQADDRLSLNETSKSAPLFEYRQPTTHSIYLPADVNRQASNVFVLRYSKEFLDKYTFVGGKTAKSSHSLTSPYPNWFRYIQIYAFNRTDKNLSKEAFQLSSERVFISQIVELEDSGKPLGLYIMADEKSLSRARKAKYDTLRFIFPKGMMVVCEILVKQTFGIPHELLRITPMAYLDFDMLNGFPVRNVSEDNAVPGNNEIETRNFDFDKNAKLTLMTHVWTATIFCKIDLLGVPGLILREWNFLSKDMVVSISGKFPDNTDVEISNKFIDKIRVTPMDKLESFVNVQTAGIPTKTACYQIEIVLNNKWNLPVNITKVIIQIPDRTLIGIHDRTIAGDNTGIPMLDTEKFYVNEQQLVFKA